MTGKKASFVDDTALLFCREEWLGEDFTHPVFPPLFKFLNIKNTDPKRRKEEKNTEEHESYS